MGACASKKKQEPSSQAAAPSEPATNNVVTEFLIKELARDTYCAPPCLCCLNAGSQLTPPTLASRPPVTVNEVEALYELFKRRAPGSSLPGPALTRIPTRSFRVSNSLVEDGLIHKEEFCLALFKNAKAESLFANRVCRRVSRPSPPRACPLAHPPPLFSAP